MIDKVNDMTKKKVRPPELQSRINRTKEEARADIAKRGTMHFRIDEKDVLRIYQKAELINKAPSSMVREWILERLNGVTQDIATTERLAALEEIISKIQPDSSPGMVSESLQPYETKSKSLLKSKAFIQIEISRSALEELTRQPGDTISLMVPIGEAK
ncbi:MAG: hypothetical protein C0469_07560 [Cyanobacteria bacterium DS2.3.42]|nr:hypothetical protein [Cyanobacteria bacterium DS2.3.42]